MPSVEEAYAGALSAFQRMNLTSPARRAVAGSLTAGALLFLVRPTFFFPKDESGSPLVPPEIAALLFGGLLALV